MNTSSNAALQKLTLFLMVQLAALNIASAQGFTDNISKRLANFAAVAPNEKVFIHSDKSVYLPGEILWFKVFNVYAATNTPSTLSSVAYIELLSTENKPVAQAKLALEQGSGSGSFIIPSSVNSGTYILRGYTNWMKNFDAHYYFSRTITVLNPFKKPVKKVGDNPLYSLSFFPEGGNLVNGLAAKVGFKILDTYGKSIDAKGVIVADKQDTVLQFQATKFGMGSFTFTPEPNRKYKGIVITPGGRLVEQSLPIALNEGYVLRCTNKDQEHLSLTITSATATNSSAYLIIHSGNHVQKAFEVNLQNNKAELLVSKSELKEGVSTITLFNNKQQPVCERLYFKQPNIQSWLHIETDKQNYQVRDKTILQINGISDSSDVSLAVTRIDSLEENNQQNIFAYLWLTSEIKGNIDSPSYYLTQRGTEVEEATDNLMLSQGWRRFNWQQVLSDTIPSFTFLPEYDGHLIKASITHKFSNATLQNKLAYLTVPGTKFQFTTATSNNEGELLFDVKKFYGDNQLVLQPADSNCSITLLNPFSEKFADEKYPDFILTPALKNLLLQKSINTQVENAYFKEKYNQFSLPETIDTTAFYGQPDARYYLDDFTRFKTMEEVMREFITQVRVRKIRDDFHYRVEDSPRKLFFDDDPLVLLDGVFVNNINNIIAFDPLKIKRVDVVTHKHYLNSLASNGIVSYTTYEGDLGGYELNPSAIVLHYEGMQFQREFYTPVYETVEQKNSRLPDFRTTLYWQPNVNKAIKNNSLSFFTSDVTGKYIAVVQGLTKDGKIGYATTSFTVSK